MFLTFLIQISPHFMFICNKFSAQKHWCSILINRFFFLFTTVDTLQSLVFWVAQVLCTTPIPLVTFQNTQFLFTANVSNIVFIEVIRLPGMGRWAFCCAFPGVSGCELGAFIVSATLHPHSHLLCPLYSDPLLLTLLPLGCISDCPIVPLS